MRLEPEQTVHAHPVVARTKGDVREAAERWLARFGPLLDEEECTEADECRRRLDLLTQLEPEGRLLEAEIAASPDNRSTLHDTLRAALRELDPLEEGLRRSLSCLAPGDPAGSVDLRRLQDRLAERAARREVAEVAGEEGLAADHLDILTSPSNWAGGLFLVLFSLGWNAFTTFHAFLMIGGMMQGIGPAALFLLLFYSLFWGVGIAMGYAAYRTVCRERLLLDGLRLTLRRDLLGTRWQKTHELAPESRAYLTDASMKQSGSQAKEVVIHNHEGKEIRLALGRPLHEQQRLVQKINGYLQAR